MKGHDVALDHFATPNRFVSCERSLRRPKGIRWSELDEDKRAAIPVLSALHRARAKRSTRSP